MPVNFREWLKTQETRHLARVLKLDSSTIRHWKRGHSIPEPRLMFRLVKLTAGRLSYASIIEPHFSRRQK